MIIAIVVSVVVCLAVILGSILFLRFTRQGRRISKMFTKGLRRECSAVQCSERDDWCMHVVGGSERYFETVCVHWGCSCV